MGSGGPAISILAHSWLAWQLPRLAAGRAGPSGSHVVRRVPKWQGRLAARCVGSQGGSGSPLPSTPQAPVVECVPCWQPWASCWPFCSLRTLDRPWGLSGLCFLLYLLAAPTPGAWQGSGELKHAERPGQEVL